MAIWHNVISVLMELRINVSAFVISSQPKQTNHRVLLRAQYLGDMGSKSQTGLCGRKVFAAGSELGLYKFTTEPFSAVIFPDLESNRYFPPSFAWNISLQHHTNNSIHKRSHENVRVSQRSNPHSEQMMELNPFCHIFDYCHVETTHCSSIQTV